ncbi:MAG: CHASE2 domain-containing protein, partial [Asticcacaulis sp.]|nr:CHASE2 domain-containing protein [Asticcacaulis sp.]
QTDRCAYSLYQPYFALRDLPPDRIETLLRDRLVLVGAKYNAGADWQSSPVQGNLPGVFVHAMALDNLLTRGEGYRKVAHSWLDLSNWVETLLLFVLLLLTNGGLLAHRAVRHLPRRRRQLLLGLTAASLVVAWIGITLAWHLHEEPINWLGVGETALVYGVLKWTRPLFEDLAEDFHGPARQIMDALRSIGGWMDIEAPSEPPQKPHLPSSTLPETHE